MAHSDPRDSGTPFKKEWHEFRAAYASARLQGWLLSEIEEISPGYFEDLHTRIDEAIEMGEIFALAGEGDTDAPLQSPTRDGVQYWDLEVAYALEDQLFPFRAPQTDFGDFARGLVLVGLHAALEAYAASLGITGRGTPLPRAVESALASRGQPLDAETSHTLLTCDAVRHLYAHNRGVVDQRYIDTVAHNTFQRDERRPVSQRDLEHFAQTIWKVAVRVRNAFAPSQP